MAKQQLRNPVRVKIDGVDVTKDTTVDDAIVFKTYATNEPDSKIEIVNVEPLKVIQNQFTI